MGCCHARVNQEEAKENAAPNCDTSDSEKEWGEQTPRNYFYLDPALVPGKIEDMNLSKEKETVVVEKTCFDHNSLISGRPLNNREDTEELNMGSCHAPVNCEKAEDNAARNLRNCDASASQEKPEEQTAIRYIELDHALVPGKIEDINISKELKTGKVEVEGSDDWDYRTNHVQKYHIEKGNIKKAIMGIIADRPESLWVIKKSRENKESLPANDLVFEAVQETSDESLFDRLGSLYQEALSAKSLSANDLVFEAVQGTLDESFYFDKDWGFFSTILACYNNHWTLRTSPDDWWTVIVKNVANAVDKNGNNQPVREFFVDHHGKKTIEVMLPGELDNVDYSWLFDQFSKGIRSNIKTPGYVDLMEADFSTTGPNQLIASQIMVMSSVQKYFSYGFSTCCGIPGVEMKGTEQDWIKIITKTRNLEKLLAPVLEIIGLKEWFRYTIAMLHKLLDTFQGNPDTKWWSHILSYNETYGSGAREWWSGWMIDFLNAGAAEKLQDFPSGVVSVPLEIKDLSVKDTGELVAGTFGFTVHEGERAPIVEAKQGWALLLPRGSPVIARMMKKFAACEN